MNTTVPTFGFALPDPDDIWLRIAEVEHDIESFAATARSMIDVGLSVIKGRLRDLERTVQNQIAGDNLAVWDNIEAMQGAITDDIASALAPVVGVARVAGITIPDYGSPVDSAQATVYDPGSGIDSQASHLFALPAKHPVPQPIPLAPQWYCIRSLVGTVDCASVTITQLRALASQGYGVVSGPHRDVATCLSFCRSAPQSMSVSTTAIAEPCITDPLNPDVCIPPGQGTGEPTVPLPTEPAPVPTEPMPTEPAPIPPEPIPTEPPVPPLPPLPPEPPRCLVWYCLSDAANTQRVCACDTALQSYLDSGYVILSGPHSDEQSCLDVCIAQPPPPPPPPPPPTPTTRYWCVIPPGVLSRICFGTDLTREQLIAQGYRVQSGPYDTEQQCRQECAIAIIPNYHFWCAEDRITHSYFCVTYTTYLDVAGNPMPPVNSQYIVRGGPYRTQSECTQQCRQQQPPPPPFEPIPPVSRWWCVVLESGGKVCREVVSVLPQGPSLGPGERVIGGPYDTAEECARDCVEGPPPEPGPPPPPAQWLCITNGLNDFKCWPSDMVPPPGWDVVSGPYDTEAECRRVCGIGVIPPPEVCWWCIQGYNSIYCSRGVCNFRPQNAISGPYATEAECRAACLLQPAPQPPTPPTPPTPPPPPAYPPPPGVITTECCEPPPDTVAADKEAHTWRCWETCEGTRYITGPSEGPHSSNDTLVGSYTSLEQALDKCSSPKVCPKPPDETAPSPPDKPGAISWGDIDVCNTIQSSVISVPQSGDCEIAKLLGIVNADGTPNTSIPGIGLIDPIKQGIIQVVLGIGGKVLCSVERWIRSLGKGDPCASSYQTMLDMAYALNSWSERIAGVDNTRFKKPIAYTQNYLCPHTIPDTQNAILAYLTNDIDEELLRCWSQANGMYWDPLKRIVQAQRRRHTATDLTRLWLREVLTDGEFSNRVRELGYLRQSDVAELRELSKQLPPYTDIIRLMVRDAGDESIADWPDSDTIWQQKYVGQLQQWGRYQGIPDEVAKLLWRAHWSIPSPGQLFTIWQRERRRGDNINATPLGAEIRAALLQQDILPRWIPHLVGTAYRILGRVDIRRSYQIGVLDREGVDAAYIQSGYSDASAGTLTEYTVRQARLALRLHSAIRSYMSFGLSRAQATLELRDYGATDPDIEWVLTWALGRMRAKSREVCAKGIKRQFNTGAIDEIETRRMLREQGLDPEQIDIAIATWQCEQYSRGKTPAAATLCKWLDAGLITGLDMLDRLLTLGWAPNDAANLVAECERRIRIRLDREEAKRRKDAIRDAEKAEREREKIAKELEKQARQRTAALEKAQLKREQRERAMLTAADKLSDKCGLPASSTMILVRDAVSYAKQVLGLTITESVSAAVLAADDYDGTDCNGYLEHAKDYALAMGRAEPAGNGNGTVR